MVAKINTEQKDVSDPVLFYDLLNRVKKFSQPESFKSKLVAYNMFLSLADLMDTVPAPSKISQDFKLKEVRAINSGLSLAVNNLIDSGNSNSYNVAKHDAIRLSKEDNSSLIRYGTILPIFVAVTTFNGCVEDNFKRLGQMFLDKVPTEYSNSQVETKLLEDYSFIVDILDKRLHGIHAGKLYR